jgi:hypothetical protein
MNNMKIIALSTEEICLIQRAIQEYRTQLEDRNQDIQLNGDEDNLSWLINKNNTEIAKLINMYYFLMEYLF